MKSFKYYFLFFGIICFISISIYAVTSFTSSNKIINPKLIIKSKSKPDTVFTLLFGGDMMGHLQMINSAYSYPKEKYEFDHWFQFVSPYIKSCNWAIANLEVTLAGKPYTGYPQFSSPDAYAVSIKNAGFDALVNANNHSQDRGKMGLERTIRILDSIDMIHTGTFKDTTQFNKDYPLIVKVAGCKIAILNYTYGTNGLLVTHPNMVNMIDSIAMINAIFKAKSLGADLIIPIMHWGIEYQTVENENQILIAKLLAKHGANAIIGMHPHVVEPIKNIKVKSIDNDSISIPVAYSLGNFVSAQTNRYCDGGIMIRLTCKRKNDKVEITNFDYLPFWVWALKSDNISSGLRSGYYLITEKQIALLNESEYNKASIFFRDVRQILFGTSEWK
jgi:poly-gamma-glutamate capsule biosynthesis protein CapA/YwtB (metallophosphatase superfamily)